MTTSGAGVTTGSSTTTNTIGWYANGPVVTQTAVTSSAAPGTNTTAYTLSPSGLMRLARITESGADARSRTVTFRHDALGQVLRRDEADANAAGDPHAISYRFDGRGIGAVGNDSTVDTTYLDSVETRGDAPGPGAFRGGAQTGVAYARFGQGFDSVSSYAQGADGGRYTVAAGDTLSGIALQLWGDASLWYKLAQANGLTADSALVEGQTLTVPAGVIRTANNASTVRPYDPSDAYGNTSPTTPKPIPPKVTPHKNKCGVFGAILLVAIAVAVTVVTSGAAAAASISAASGGASVSLGAGITAAFGGTLGAAAGAAAGFSLTTVGMIGVGVLGAAVGSVASQAFGVATGLQDKFDWKGVALAGLSGGVGGGLGSVIRGTGTLAGAARGLAGNAISQGIGVATGLQGNFDWAGLAAAGIGALGRGVVGGGYAGAGADLVASAAGRSLLTGSSFGDNLMSALPGVIGNTIGGYIASKVAGIGRSSRADTPNTVIDPQTGQKVVVDAALADQINLRRDGKRIDAEIAAGIRNPDGSLRDGGAPGGSVTVVDASGRPPGDYLDPDRADTFSRSINEYWRQGFEATDAAHLASVGHEYTDAPELRQAYADRDAYLAKLDAYATQMVDKPIGLALGSVVVTAATAGTGTVAAGYLGLTGWSAFGAGVVTDGVAAGNGGLFYHPLVGERNSFGSYGRDVLVGAGTGGVLRVLGKGVSWGVGRIGNSGATAAEQTFATRQATARSAYEAMGWSDARISNHMAGIDFNYPVDMIPLAQGDALVQHMVPGSPVGNYFAPAGTSASELGINPAGRIATFFSPTAEVSVLRSTAAPIVDTWTVPGTAYRASGGGTQYLTNNPSYFRRVP